MRIHHYLLSAILAAASPLALSDDDHDRARRALQAGEILPLHVLLETVAREHPGQVLEVELEREDGTWLYELKLLRGDGALLKLEFDARSGTLLRSRRKAE